MTTNEDADVRVGCVGYVDVLDIDRPDARAAFRPAVVGQREPSFEGC